MRPKPREEPTAHSDKLWDEEFKRQLCPGCKRRYRRFCHEPVHYILEDAPNNAPLVIGVAVGLPANLMRRDLLCILEPYMKGFLFGTVMDRAGTLYDQFVTCTVPSRLPIRGDASSVLDVCPVCGQFKYYPMPFEKGYALHRDLPDPSRLYESLCGLVMREEIAEAIPVHFRKRFKIAPLPVRDEPIDGLDAFPEAPP